MKYKFNEKHIIYYVLAVTLIIYGLINIYALNNVLSDADDNALYIILAKSIATGQGYREISSPGQPVHQKFPPLFPILLSPVVYLFGDNIFALKAFMILFNIGGLIVVFLLFKELTKNEFLAYGLMFLTGFSFQYFDWGSDIMSEVPFLLFSFLTLYFVLKEKGYWAILSMIAAFFIKSTGIVLLPAVVLYLLTKKRFKDAALTFVIVALIFGIWMYNNRDYSDSYVNLVKYVNPYAKDLGVLTLPSLAERIGHNLLVHMVSISHAIFQYDDKMGMFQDVLVFLLIFTTFVGIWSQIIKRETLLVFYTLGFIGFLLLWPWDSNMFLFPLMPALLFFFVQGCFYIFDYFDLTLNIKHLTALKYTFMIFLMFLTLFGFGEKVFQMKTFQYQGWQSNYNLMAKWAKENTPPDKIFLVRKPYMFYLWSNRTTKLYPFTMSKQKWFDAVVWSDYVVKDELGSETDMYLDSFVRDIPKLFEVSYAVPNSNSKIYKITAVEDTSVEVSP